MMHHREAHMPQLKLCNTSKLNELLAKSNNTVFQFEMFYREMKLNENERDTILFRVYTWV